MHSEYVHAVRSRTFVIHVLCEKERSGQEEIVFPSLCVTTS